MRGYQYRTDEKMTQARQAIRAALTKAKRPADGLEYYELYARVRVREDGALALELPQLVNSERSPSFVPGTHPWLEFRLQYLPLDDGLKLFLSGDSPLVELSRRQHVLSEEERALAIKIQVDRLAQLEANRKAAAEAARNKAWRSLSPIGRALARHGAGASLEHAAHEESTPTSPPDGWVPKAEVQPGEMAKWGTGKWGEPGRKWGAVPSINDGHPGLITTEPEVKR